MSAVISQAAAAYRRAGSAVRPIVAVVKLYDLTIKHIHRAIAALEAKQIEEAHVQVEMATTILRGLMHNLDFDQGGAVAEQLSGVYNKNILALHTSFGKPDVAERYRKLAAGLSELRDAWAEVAGLATPAG